jgi:hypothetical protein
MSSRTRTGAYYDPFQVKKKFRRADCDMAV